MQIVVIRIYNAVFVSSIVCKIVPIRALECRIDLDYILRGVLVHIIRSS
jgi:hypothetical protein